MSKYNGLGYFVGCGIAIVALIGFSAWWHYQVWFECREQHSFFYCYHTVFK